MADRISKLFSQLSGPSCTVDGAATGTTNPLTEFVNTTLKLSSNNQPCSLKESIKRVNKTLDIMDKSFKESRHGISSAPENLENYEKLKEYKSEMESAWVEAQGNPEAKLDLEEMEKVWKETQTVPEKLTAQPKPKPIYGKKVDKKIKNIGKKVLELYEYPVIPQANSYNDPRIYSRLLPHRISVSYNSLRSKEEEKKTKGIFNKDGKLNEKKFKNLYNSYIKFKPGNYEKLVSYFCLEPELEISETDCQTFLNNGDTFLDFIIGEFPDQFLEYVNSDTQFGRGITLNEFIEKNPKLKQEYYEHHIKHRRDLILNLLTNGGFNSESESLINRDETGSYKFLYDYTVNVLTRREPKLEEIIKIKNIFSNPELEFVGSKSERKPFKNVLQYLTVNYPMLELPIVSRL